MKNLTYEAFADVDLMDPFFDSLKSDYGEFTEWFKSKAKSGAKAYIIRKIGIQGFMYLKHEVGPIDDCVPALPAGNYLKVGTFKFNAHGTRLGQRFIKKLFDHAINEGVDGVYVTAFPEHGSLLEIFRSYGFEISGKKEGPNGEELVLLKSFGVFYDDVLKDYPRVKIEGVRAFLLAIYPEYHTKFLPDSKLNNESFDIVADVSHANSIHKIYLSGVAGTRKLKRGDLLVMYRTSDKKGPAYYRSVATSICMVEEVRVIGSFSTEADFLQYALPYSVFDPAELKKRFENKKRHVMIKFTYNMPLVRRIIRGRLLDEVGIPGGGRRWDFVSLTDDQLRQIISMGMVNENYFIN